MNAIDEKEIIFKKKLFKCLTSLNYVEDEEIDDDYGFILNNASLDIDSYPENTYVSPEEIIEDNLRFREEDILNLERYYESQKPYIDKMDILFSSDEYFKKLEEERADNCRQHDEDYDLQFI